MPHRRQRLGGQGETLAVAFLEGRGFQVRERNYRCAEGEMDIVAQQGDCLVFVEVKTRRGENYGGPEEAITRRKRERLLAVAAAYEQEHDDLPPLRRIDVVSVKLGADGPIITHLENAVEA